ncbi:MAG TPA: beta-propeller fold lactonase family protein [Polyangiaceae bacterium]|jgi:6-phosphogluconolactonase (cycloisomerase 2 family)
MKRVVAVVGSIAAFVVVGACSSSNSSDDAAAPGNRGGNSGSSANAAGNANAAGSANAGSSAKGGNSASGGSAPSAGNAGNASGGSSNSGGAGASNGDAGMTSNGGADAGSSNTGDAGAAGEAGANAEFKAEFMYVPMYLGGIFAYSLDSGSGKLTELSGSPVRPQGHANDARVDAAGHFLYVANDANSIDAYAIATNGSLPSAPSFSHATSARPPTLTIDSTGRRLYVACEGDGTTVSAIEAYAIDAQSGTLSAIAPPLAIHGAPSYLALDQSGHFLYASQSSETGIRAFSVDPTSGALTELGTSPFAAEFVFSGALVVSPNGKYLYSSGNGLNGFAIESDSGKLDRLQDTAFTTDISSDPSATNLATDPRGRFLYVTQFNIGHHVFGFSIGDDGKLTPTQGPAVATGAPYAAAVDPSGRFLLVGNDDPSGLSTFSLARDTGKLKELGSSPNNRSGLQPEVVFAP